MGMLCRELCEEARPTEVRQAAGVALKNALVAKDPQLRQEYARRWLTVEPSVRDQMKLQLSNALGARDYRAGTAAAQATSAIAFVELPVGGWPNLLETLLTNAASANENMRRCTLEAIGFICEEIEPRVLKSQSNVIMTVVVNGLRASETSMAVRAAAARAMFNCLEFARDNFDTDGERDMIMNVVCTATQAGDESIVLPAFECLVRIMQLYYEKMGPYMQHAIARLTIESIKSPDEAIKLQGIEFWSTVCDIEIILQEDELADEPPRPYYSKSALPHLLPALLESLRHEEEHDEDEWNPAMAAGTCLGLLSECVKDDIFKGNVVMSFVIQNVQSPDWRCREAAVMAFGSVMDGPSMESMSHYLSSALPVMLGMLADTFVAVRDSAAWTLGRLIDFFHELVPMDMIPRLTSVLTMGLKDAPRVAVNCCWSLMSMFIHLGDDSSVTGESLPGSGCAFFTSNEFALVAQGLFEAAQRPDADEHNLRSAAYQSLANVVLYAPVECAPAIRKLQEAIIGKLGESQSLADLIVGVEDRMRYSELQSHLCTVLQSSVKKLGRPTMEHASSIMTCVLSIFANAARGRGSATELEDALLLVGTLIEELESDFAHFMVSFSPLLYGAIQNHAEYHLCTVAVGVVGDLGRALGPSLLGSCDQLMMLLLEALQDPALARDVKPHVVSAIGDIATGVGAAFVKYLPSTMGLFAQAGAITTVDEEDFDEVDFVCQLRESLLEAYICIVQGLKDDQEAVGVLSSYVEQIMRFVQATGSDPQRTDIMVRAAIGLVGDLTDTYKGQLRPMLASPWVAQLINVGSEVSESTRSVANWTQSLVRSVV